MYKDRLADWIKKLNEMMVWWLVVEEKTFIVDKK